MSGSGQKPVIPAIIVITLAENQSYKSELKIQKKTSI